MCNQLKLQKLKWIITSCRFLYTHPSFYNKTKSIIKRFRGLSKLTSLIFWAIPQNKINISIYLVQEYECFGTIMIFLLHLAMLTEMKTQKKYLKPNVLKSYSLANWLANKHYKSKKLLTYWAHYILRLWFENY